MHVRALVAAFGLATAFGVPPDVASPVHVQQVELAPFSSQHSALFTPVDDGSTYAQQIYDHIPTEAPDVAGDVSHWRVGGVDLYLVTPRIG